ncbi:MAG TPA: site-specific integrase [Spirochaetia bacterium]|nr:site-specific integrase [Spirochaetia bacterium]
MGRPRKEIKYKLDQASGRYMVSFAESPETFHMTPETDLEKALAWGRRNKNRILAAPEKPLLFKDLAPGFFDEDGAWYQDRVKKGQPMTAASLGIRQSHIVNYIVPLFGDYDIREILGADIDRIILDAERFTAREGATTAAAKKPLARGTRSKLLYSLKLMYDRWIYLGLVKHNPTAIIQKYSKDPERPRSALPEEALDRLFPATHGELVQVWGSSMWASLMLVLWDTGNRPGEVRAPLWGEYYPEERYLPVRKAIEGGTKDKKKGTKGGTIKPSYLSERTAQELAIWRAESRFHQDTDYIFTVTGKAPVTDAAIGDAFARALARLRYDSNGWTPYYLRHTFVTYALRSLDDLEVQMLTGHTNLATNKLYRHPTDEIMLERTKHLRNKLDQRRTSTSKKRDAR